MEIHRALLRDKHGHPDIAMAVDGKPGSDWLISYFNDQVQGGVRFKAGQTIQIGWGLLKLTGDDDGELSVSEPDFSSMPVRWVEGASRVMRHFIIQREVCDQIGVEPLFPSMVEPGVVSPSFVSGPSAFSMSRDQTGWLFVSKHDAGHQAELHSLYAVGIERPAIIPFLALPSNAEILWEEGCVEITLDGLHQSSTSNSFLKKLVDSPAFL